MTVRVEIREPDRPPRVIAVDQALELGRECDGELLADPYTSRRHVRLRPTNGGLVAEDLGSTHGTTLNSKAITGEVVVRAGDVLVVGRGLDFIGVDPDLPLDVDREVYRTSDRLAAAGLEARASEPVPRPLDRYLRSVLRDDVLACARWLGDDFDGWGLA